MSTASEIVRSRLAVGFRLDSLWAETTGIDPSDTKERPLRLVAKLLDREGVAYALIGGPPPSHAAGQANASTISPTSCH